MSENSHKNSTLPAKNILLVGLVPSHCTAM